MKKLMMFLMVAIPILVILIVKLTASVAVGDVFISVEYINLTPAATSAKVGESMDMEYYIFPEMATNKEVLWSSSNEQAATVDMDGHVEFVGIGTGYIIATTKDGNRQAQCSFYVWDTKLSAPQNYVHIGGTLQLNVEISPNEAINKEVTFTSNNEQIATVDTNGLVHGLQEGKVTIMATSEDGGFKNSVDLSVVNPVKGIVVEKSEIVTSSKTEKVEFLIEPSDASNKSVLFEVDNPEVAQVSNDGTITFLKAGEVNVTLTTEDGNFSQKVHYIFTDGYAYDLVLETHSVTMQVDSEPVYIEYSTLPEHLYNTHVEFSSDEESVAYVDSNGYIHALKAGNTVVRVKVEKSDGQILEQTVLVNVECPATEIFIDDVMVAEKETRLNPQSDGLNVEYFYHLHEEDLSKAEVSPSGVVSFKCDEPCTVTVTIYANGDLSEVSKDVKVTYTAGGAGKFNLLDKKLTLTYGDTASLNYEVLPTNATIRNLFVTIEQSNPIVEGSNVIEILEDGRIHALGGGTAKVKAQFELFDGSMVEDFCDVTVLRNPSDIQIFTDLEVYKDQYITSQNEVTFSGKVVPDDATETEIVWSISDKNIAILAGKNTLIFNQVGFVTLTATVGQVSNSVEIYYAGLNPVYAEVQALFDGQKGNIPEKIEAGESFEIEISKTIPQYEVLPPISIQVTNQRTADPLGKVLEIDGNVVKGVAGGTATLVVYVSNSIRLNFAISVERKPESISVRQADTQVTTNVVNLTSEVLPYDATNKNVRYVVKESDIAFVEGSTLTFKQNGIAHITAISEADENVRLEFFVEKIEKNMVHVLPEQRKVEASKGDLLTFDISDNFTLEISSNSPIVDGGNVVQVEAEKYLRATFAGEAKVSLRTAERVYEFEIVVKQLVENIVFSGNFDFFNDEYVVASDVVDLDFEIYPVYSENKDIKISIEQSVAAEGETGGVAYISNRTVYFTKAGSVLLQIKSVDGNCTTFMRLRYTGGTALDAELNVGNRLVMNVGERVTIGVSKWLPFDVKNTQISFREVSSTGKKVIEINSNTRTIVAVDSGETKLLVELSGGIVKEVEIICVNKVSDIQVEENVLTASDTYTIEAVAVPKNATNNILEFILQNTDIAQISGNILHFIKPGTATVFVRTTDGSGIEKVVRVTSTMGYLGRIELNSQELSLTKGDIFKLFADKYPTDAKENSVQFKILSQTAYDGSSQVINLSADGQITALCSGEAIVRAFAFDFNGNEVFADCKVSVYSPLDSVDVKFGQKLDTYQNSSTFITSRTELTFEIVYQPNDAKVKDYAYEVSAPNIARIEGNTIKFLQKGRVSITFKCKDTSNLEKSKTYSFFYVGNELFEAQLDTSEIQNNTIRLNAGESFEFKLKKALPSDIENVEFSISNTSESRNDSQKPVANFENGMIYALNGGTYSFTLYANGFKLENLTLIVLRNATAIELDGDSEVFVSDPHYTILANVRESDSHQNSLHFESRNEGVATVSQTGNVTFSRFGECEIVVSVADNPSVFVVVKIVYTKDLQAIKFNQTRENMYAGEHVDLMIFGVPIDAEDFEFTMSLGKDEAAFADLIKMGEGYRLIGKASGKVNVTAKVVGKDISVTKEFNIFDKITDIKLELDNSGDNDGLGGYRVFGNSFFDEKNTIVKTFAMNVALRPDGVSKDLLEWKSSDEGIATVDQNGVVTFVGTGRVVISVQQKSPYDGAVVVGDSYEFVVVEGVNVNTYDQFKLANQELTKLNAQRKDSFAAMVLHNNIAIEKEFAIVEINYNIYGNGKMLDHSQIGNSWIHFLIKRDNIVLDNVVLRGVSFTSGAELKDSGNTLTVQNCSNVLLYNSIFENAATSMQVLSASVDIEGCIFRNCLLYGIKVERSEQVVCHIKVKDSIFTSGFCGIFFKLVLFQNEEDSVVTLEGEVRFYNWSTLEQIQQGVDLETVLRDAGVSFVSDEVLKQVREIVLRQGTNYAYTQNGKTYYNCGIFKLKADIPGLNYKSHGRIEKSKLNPNCAYSNWDIVGAVNLGIVVPVECSILSISAAKPFILPGQSYVDDGSLRTIKRPCRF